MGALFVSYLFYGSTASSFWSPENRFFFHWQFSDALAVMLLFTLSSLLLVCLWVLFTHAGRWGRVSAEIIFVCTTAFLMKVNVMEMILHRWAVPSWVNLGVKGVLLLLVVALLFRRSRIFASAKVVVLVASPVVILYFYTLLTATSYRTGASLPERDGQHPEPPPGIVLVVFDEWSYQRTFSNGVVLADYPNIAAAAETAYVFHHAYSPAPMTYDSIPSLINGVAGKSHLVDGSLWMRSGAVDQPVGDYSNMFAIAHHAGYQTVLIGNYLPYESLYGDALDVVHAWNIYKVLGEDVGRVALSLLLDNIRIRAGRLAPPLAVPFNRAKNRYFATMAGQLQALLETHASRPAGRFVFAHHSVPHMPLIFDRTGLALPLSRAASVNIEAYLGNLRYLDTLIGRFLKTADGDRGLWILTSDHSFRFDPEHPGDESVHSPKRHVPLLLHIPGQTARTDIHTPFLLSHLKRLLAELMQTNRPHHDVIKTLHLINHQKDTQDESNDTTGLH
ncbi:sulfatase-like hydrolase/transferase [bacterium]|nr:sulfatase-like hydrolase/transferase [bacterium]